MPHRSVPWRNGAYHLQKSNIKSRQDVFVPFLVPVGLECHRKRGVHMCGFTTTVCIDVCMYVCTSVWLTSLLLRKTVSGKWGEIYSLSENKFWLKLKYILFPIEICIFYSTFFFSIFNKYIFEYSWKKNFINDLNFIIIIIHAK